MGRVFVIGVGMTKFEKPGKRPGDYPELAKEAITKALDDCNLKISDVQAGVAGYVYGSANIIGESSCGQRAIYEFGMTGIPIINVNNNGATGSTAIMVGKEFIQAGDKDCVLVVGFDKMDKGSLSAKFEGRTSPLEKLEKYMTMVVGANGNGMAVRLYGNAAYEHFLIHGTKPEHFAKIAWKNHKHSVNNPYALFRKEFTLDQVLNSKQVFELLTGLQICPLSDGSAAAVLASEKFVREHGLEAQAVEILGMEMATDTPESYENSSCITLVGYDMAKKASECLYAKTNICPDQIQVAEVDDSYAPSELIAYEGLGFCPQGKAGEFIDRGDNTYGGKIVVNPSGGLLSRGHPLGATGIAQLCELVWQLRGTAGARQVPDAKVALQHNFSLGSCVVVALYKLGFPECQPTKAIQAQKVFGEEPGFTAAPIIDKVASILSDEWTKSYPGVYGLKVKKPEPEPGYWDLYFRIAEGVFEINSKLKPVISYTVDITDFNDLLCSRILPIMGYFLGRMKVVGNMTVLHVKLTDIQDFFANKIQDKENFTSLPYMRVLGPILEEHFTTKYKGKYAIKIKKPDSDDYWCFLFEISPLRFEFNNKLTPDVTFCLNLEDFDDIFTNRVNILDACAAGKLKIEGQMPDTNERLQGVQQWIIEKILGFKHKI